MKNKLTLDTHSKVWWVSIVSLILVLAQQIGHLVGWEITSDMVNQIMAIVNTALAIAGSMGLLYNTSKKDNNISDSNSGPTEVKTPTYQNSTNLRRN